MRHGTVARRGDSPLAVAAAPSSSPHPLRLLRAGPRRAASEPLTSRLYKASSPNTLSLFGKLCLATSPRSQFTQLIAFF
jgi:hypothetical protein